MDFYITEYAAGVVETVSDAALNSIDEALVNYPKDHLIHVSLMRQVLLKKLIDDLGRHTRYEFIVHVVPTEEKVA